MAKERYLRGWTQDVLVAKLNLTGCYMTVSILASIETRRCPVTDLQLEYFAFIFRVPVQDLFPKERHFSGRPVGLAKETPRRHRRKPVCHRRVWPNAPQEMTRLHGNPA